MIVACTPPGATDEPGPVQSQAPAYTTPVPAPGGATIDDVEETASPVDTVTVALKDSAEIGRGVESRVEAVKKIDVTAQTPGEVDGTAVAVTIVLVNGGDEAIDVSSAMVSLLGTNGLLGQPTTSEPYRPFGGDIAPGESAEAVYVFLLPEDARSAFEVSVQYRAGTTVARFVDES